MRGAVLVIACLLLSFPVHALAADSRPPHRTSVQEVSHGVMCPTCDTTLDRSNSPAADRMRDYIKDKVDQGWTKKQIEDGLVKQYGGDEAILATPRAHGIGLLAWGVPALVALLGLISGVVLVRRWRGRRG